jgi:hypothetical protein
MLKGMKYAKMNKLSDLLEKAEEEIVLAGKLDHPNIAKTFICFNEGDDRSGKLYTVLQVGDLGVIAEPSDETGNPTFVMN